MWAVILKYGARINWLLLGIVILAFGLRIYQLDKHDFWFDEVVTHIQISDGFSESRKDILNNFFDTHPPFYYFLLRYWSVFFGGNEFVLRFFSLIFGVLSVIFTYKLAKLSFKESTALWAAALLAVSPFNIWYSQEARMFTLSTCLSILNVYFFLKILFGEKNSASWTGYFISLVFLLFTTYFGFFLLLPQAIFILYNRKALLKWAIAMLLAGVIFLIFALPIFMHQLETVRYKFWLSSLYNAGVICNSISNFVFGYNSSQLIHSIAPVLIVGIGLFSLFNMPVKTRVILGSFLAVPIFAVFIFSKIFFPIYIDRHLIIFSPFLYIILSNGIYSLKYRFFRLAVIFLFAACIISSLFNYYYDKLPFRHSNDLIFLKKPVRPIVDLFLQNKAEGDIIGFSNYGFAFTFRHYLEGVSKEYSEIPEFYFYIPAGDKYLENALTKINSFKLQRLYKFIDLEKDGLNNIPGKRIWLFSVSWKRSGNLEPYARKVRSWFDKRCLKLGGWYTDGVWADIYELE